MGLAVAQPNAAALLYYQASVMATEDQNLRLLSIFHYVVAGLAAVFSLFPIFHVVIGMMMVFGKLDDGPSPPPAVLGWLFALMGMAIIVLGLAFAACYAYAGVCLARRRYYMYCLVMAGIGCMFMPFGTVLGVFTIVELQKEPVKRMFMSGGTAPSAAS